MIMTRGIFITLEGGDGAGKTTHLNSLAKKLREMDYEVVIVREPGGTRIGEQIREVLLDNDNIDMTARTELFLYEAARSQIVAKVIKPALAEGKVVLCDRFFDSTVAYQGYGRGLDVEEIKKANLFTTDGLVPDRTVVIFTDTVENSMYRATKNDGADRIEAEGEEFQRKVWNGFLELAKTDAGRIRLVNLQPSKEETFKLVFDAVKDLFN